MCTLLLLAVVWTSGELSGWPAVNGTPFSDERLFRRSREPFLADFSADVHLLILISQSVRIWQYLKLLITQTYRYGSH